MLYPEISSSELIEKLESDDFYKLYGNPVKCKIFDTDRIYDCQSESEPCADLILSHLTLA